MSRDDSCRLNLLVRRSHNKRRGTQLSTQKKACRFGNLLHNPQQAVEIMDGRMPIFPEWRTPNVRRIVCRGCTQSFLRVLRSNAYHYFSPSVSFLQMLNCLSGLIQAVAFVDDRRYLLGLNEFAQNGEILMA